MPLKVPWQFWRFHKPWYLNISYWIDIQLIVKWKRKMFFLFHKKPSLVYYNICKICMHITVKIKNYGLLDWPFKQQNMLIGMDDIKKVHKNSAPTLLSPFPSLTPQRKNIDCIKYIFLGSFLCPCKHNIYTHTQIFYKNVIFYIYQSASCIFNRTLYLYRNSFFSSMTI